MSDQGQGRKRSSVLSAPKVGEGGWGDEGQKPSLPRAFINERSRAFGQPGYDLDPAVEFECIV